MFARHGSRFALLAVLVAATATTLAPVARAESARDVPPWLQLKGAVTARVDLAPWPVFDEPEAALTASVTSLARDFSDDPARPDDIVYEPVGVRVRIVRVEAGGRIALVHGITARFQAYAPVERLVPDIPPGTTVIAAGGFGGFADFYPALATPQRSAERIATGRRLRVLGLGVAPYDPDSSDLVRARIRVLDGPQRGRDGWIPVAYTGIPSRPPFPADDVAEQACSCRLIGFGNP